MNSVERYNESILRIEELSKDPAWSLDNIWTDCANRNGLTKRDTSTVFNYILGIDLHTYIRSR